MGKWLLKSIGGMVIILDQIAMASYFNIWVLCNILESTLDCFASPINSAKLQQLTLGYAVFQGPEVPLTFVIITHIQRH